MFYWDGIVTLWNLVSRLGLDFFYLCFSGDSVIKKARPVLNVPLHFLLYIIVETFETMVAKNCTLFWLPQIPEVPLYLLCFCCALNVQCNPFGSALPKIHSFPLINHNTSFCFHAYVFFIICPFSLFRLVYFFQYVGMDKHILKQAWDKLSEMFPYAF